MNSSLNKIVTGLLAMLVSTGVARAEANAMPDETEQQAKVQNLFQTGVVTKSPLDPNLFLIKKNEGASTKETVDMLHDVLGPSANVMEVELDDASYGGQDI